jgi:hypothetical protein
MRRYQINRHRRFNKLYRAMVYQPPKPIHTKEIYPGKVRVMISKDETTLQNTVICKTNIFFSLKNVDEEPNMRPENTDDFANRR